jgi:hypothetical protein
VRLLNAVPEFRQHLPALAAPEHGHVWNEIAKHWDMLEAMYRRDLPTGESNDLYHWIVDRELEACEHERKISTGGDPS